MSHWVEESSTNLLVSGSNPGPDIIIMSAVQTLHHMALTVIALEHRVNEVLGSLKHLQIRRITENIRRKGSSSGLKLKQVELRQIKRGNR